MTAPAPVKRSSQGYWQSSRSPRYSLLFALPLLAGYELLAVTLPIRETHGVRNGAEVLFRSLFDTAVGSWGAAAFGAVVLGVAGYFVGRDIKKNGPPRRAVIYAGMFLESLLLAAFFAVTAALITRRLLDVMHLAIAAAPTAAAQGAAPIDAPTRLMVSLGAGVFEELLFRVVLVSGLIVAARVLFGTGTAASATIAVVLSAVIFAASHYVGPYGDRLELPSFLFRTVSGLLFSVIYVLRGFGIVAWTHALYDVGLLILSGP